MLRDYRPGLSHSLLCGLFPDFYLQEFDQCGPSPPPSQSPSPCCFMCKSSHACVGRDVIALFPSFFLCIHILERAVSDRFALIEIMPVNYSLPPKVEPPPTEQKHTVEKCPRLSPVMAVQHRLHLPCFCPDNSLYVCRGTAQLTECGVGC